jgi:hypothetical protein
MRTIWEWETAIEGRKEEEDDGSEVDGSILYACIKID